MKYVSWILAVVSGLLAVEIIVHGWTDVKYAHGFGAKDFVAYIQMMITFLTAVLVAVFNAGVTRSNEQLRITAAETLARLQSDLNGMRRRNSRDSNRRSAALLHKRSRSYNPAWLSRQLSRQKRYGRNSRPLSMKQIHVSKPS